MSYDNVTARPISEFNDAIGLLRRIDFLLKMCHAGRISKDAALWFDGLLGFFQELSTYMNDDEVRHYKTLMNELNGHIAPISQKYGNSGALIIPSYVFNKLFNWELDLRKIYDKSGLQNRLQDDAARSLK